MRSRSASKTASRLIAAGLGRSPARSALRTIRRTPTQDLPVITIKRVDHISMAHPSWKDQSQWLERVLGFSFHYSFPAGPDEDFDGSVSRMRNTDVDFEVISPVAFASSP